MGRAGWVAGVLGAVLLAACGGGDNGAPDEQQEPRLSQFAPPAAGMLLLDWSGASWTGALLKVLEARTGRDDVGYPPLDVDDVAGTALAPDRRTLAVAVYRHGNPMAGELRLVALNRWGESFSVPDSKKGPPTDPRSFRAPGYLTWSPDSSRVFFTTTEGEESLRQRLWVLDVKTKEARALVELDFGVQRLNVSPDGESVYLLGFPEPDLTTGVATGDAFLAVVNADTGAMTAKIGLPGVLAGWRREEREEGEVYADYWPGVAVSPDGGRYYVVHADDDRMTVVDLRSLQVERSVAVSRRRSLLERLGSTLLDLIVESAAAKGGPFVRKEALVSPDGRWLYVTGSSSDLCTGERAVPCETDKPAGLKIIDTKSLQEVRREDGIGSIALSPDGRWVLGTGWWYVAEGDSTFMTLEGQGLTIIDARSHRVVARIGPEVAFQQMSVSADGRYVHLMSEGPGLRDAMRNKYRCEQACWMLSVVDLEVQEIVSERPLYGPATLVGSW